MGKNVEKGSFYYCFSGIIMLEEITDVPKGLFLVGDVIFDQFNDDGTVDIGTSMEKSSGLMFERMKEGIIRKEKLEEKNVYRNKQINNTRLNGSRRTSVI